MSDLVRIGSETAKGGFANEEKQYQTVSANRELYSSLKYL